MSEILGKVTTASHVIPRGADVSLRISVPPRWLDEGRTIEVELPRNLTCAKCGGGGCSACSNAGAITLRSRNELPELVQVVLPLSSLVDSSTAGTQEEPASQRSQATTSPDPGPRSDKRPVGPKPIVIRVPECGGLPDSAKGEIIRGWLLLQVDCVGEPSPNVTTLDDDAIDSSKLLRAVVRSSGKCATGPTFKAVVLPRRSRSTPAADERNASRGTSTPARARSNSPKSSSQKTNVSVADPERIASMPSQGRARSLSAVRGYYIGLAVVVAAATTALLSWLL